MKYSLPFLMSLNCTDGLIAFWTMDDADIHGDTVKVLSLPTPGLLAKSTSSSRTIRYRSNVGAAVKPATTWGIITAK